MSTRKLAAIHAIGKFLEQRSFIFYFSAIFIIYLALTYFFSGFSLTNVSPSSYYNFLLDALFRHQLYVNPPNNYDLSLYQSHRYLYWGPAAILYILPYYLISHLQASDTLYTCVAGILNILVFYFLIQEASRYFKIKPSKFIKLILVVSFAFASPNFFLALKANIWFSSQIIATFYLLLFFLCLFKFLNQTQKLSWWWLAVLLVNLAWLTRYTMVFNLLFLTYPLYILYHQRSQLFKRALLGTGLLLSIFFCGFLMYNFARFNNALETGYRYQQGATRYAIYFRNNQMFSLSNIPHNFNYYFLSPNIWIKSSTFPFVHSDAEGNSIFFVYPILILWLLSLGVAYQSFKHQHFFHNFFRDPSPSPVFFFQLITAVTVAFNILVLLLNVGTGWVQFGSRYFLDVTPIIFLSLLFIIDRFPKVLLLWLLAWGLIVNFTGVIFFYK
ncbi:MAG: hypothetical protein M1142_01445 [Patescibacteria group bacterium]|nr:hypothetical protein [Patescibacteria group bacterium]